MPGRTVSEFQADVDAWIQQVGGGYWSPHVNLARIAEEVGELARILNHQFGPSPFVFERRLCYNRHTAPHHLTTRDLIEKPFRDRITRSA